eukprot:c19770_g1_i2.p1 GENE.c19770_g1_i2~~c19770_g1_i2.p1  ORF type:complete len:195 (+),score=52.90 c19770_g1_i2:549-1133(+)
MHHSSSSNFSLGLQVAAACLISLEHRSLRIFIALLIGIELSVVLVMVMILLSILHEFGSTILKRRVLCEQSAKWTVPSDGVDMRGASEQSLGDSKKHPQNATQPKVFVGYMGLPIRARVAFAAVVFGLLLIATQSTEKFSELMFQFVGKQAFTRPEITHIIYRILEAFVGFAISHSSSVISQEERPQWKLGAKR